MTSPSSANARFLRTYRPLTSRIIGWVLVAILTLALGVTLLGEGEIVPGFVAWVALALVATWLILLRPCVTLSTSGVTIQNLVRDVDVPWGQVESLGTRWALEVRTSDGREYSSWAIPAKRTFSSKEEEFAESSQMPGAQLPRAGSRLSAERMVGIIETVRAARRRGELPREEPAFDTVQVRWSQPALAALVVTGVAAVALAFI